MSVIQQYPHCDPQVLHEPKSCDYCDAHPDWQELRETWKINFTGKNEPGKSQCPSERNRPAYRIHQWAGDRPTNVEVEVEAPAPMDAIERLLDD